MKIRFESDDDFPLDKALSNTDMITVVASVLEKNDQHYPQLAFQKELTLMNHMHQKNACFIIIGILKVLDLHFNHMFVINVSMF